MSGVAPVSPVQVTYISFWIFLVFFCSGLSFGLLILTFFLFLFYCFYFVLVLLAVLVCFAIFLPSSFSNHSSLFFSSSVKFKLVVFYEVRRLGVSRLAGQSCSSPSKCQVQRHTEDLTRLASAPHSMVYYVRSDLLDPLCSSVLFLLR